MIKHYVKLDLSKRDERKIISVSKSDQNSHKIIFTLTNGATPVTLPTDAVAWVNVRGSGSPVEKADVFPTDNTIEYTPTSKAFTSSGFVVCYLQISDTVGRILYSPSFYLYVEESGKDILSVFDSTVTSSNAGPQIAAILRSAIDVLGTEGDNVQTHAENAEAWAVGEIEGEPVDETKEQHENNAKYYAGQAKSSASSAGSSAKSAEDSAQNSRKSAENASKAEQAATEAKNATILKAQQMESIINSSSLSVVLGPTPQTLTFELSNSNGELINSQTVQLPLDKCVEKVFEENHAAQIKKIDSNTKRIKNLESRLPIGSFVEDSSVAYQKTVPVNACPYAQINKIGGRTYTCTNLLKYPSYYNTTKNHNGIHFTDNGDGSITLNGKNNGAYQSAFYLFHKTNPLHLEAGKYYISVNDSTINIFVRAGTHTYSDYFFLATATDVVIYLQIPQFGSATSLDVTYENVTVYPMLNKGTTALPWEQYFEGLRDAKVTALEVRSANLLNPAEFKNGRSWGTVTIKSNGKGAWAINGSYAPGGIGHAGVGELYRFDCPKGFYTLSTKETLHEDFQLNIRKIGKSNDKVVEDTGSIYKSRPTFTFEVTEEDALNCYIRISGEIAIPSSFDNVTVYPMLNKGNTALPYSTYMVNAFEIPEEIQAIEGYGQSNPDNPNEYNYIDFERKMFVAYGYMVDGVWVAYAESIETDISEYLTDNFMAVVGGGTITAVNEYKQTVPSTITYLTETVGE